MEITKFKYSAGKSWFAVITLLAIIFLCLYAVLTDSKGDNIWELMAPAIFVLGTILSYVGIKFFIPYRRGDTILELDKEGFHYAPKNSTVYWKDVERIDYVVGIQTRDWSIRFEMKDDSGLKRISTKYIKGRGQAIYDTIMEYFEKYRTDS